MSLQLFALMGQRALTTGSSEGIGLPLAQGLGRIGAAVVLKGRDEAKVEQAAWTLSGDGIGAHSSVFYVIDPMRIASAVDTVRSTLRPIDSLVSNAGIQRRRPLEDVPIGVLATL